MLKSLTKDQYIHSCTEVLKTHGARITQPRLAVLQCLADSTQPLSPKDILENIQTRKDLGNVDQVSVYRILDKLLKLNLIHQISPQGQFVACGHIECQAPLHILTHCQSCTETQELHVPDGVLAPMLWYLKEEYHFSPHNHYFQIDGTCKSCQQKTL